MTTVLTKQDVNKMRRDIEAQRIIKHVSPIHKHWEVNRILKTLDHFYDELICEGCFDPNCGKLEKTLIFKTLDSFREDMSLGYIVEQLLRWIIESGIE